MKSSGYIWFKESFLDKGKFRKEYWVDKRIAELNTILNLKTKEDWKRILINGKPISKNPFAKNGLFRKLKQGDHIEFYTTPQGGKIGGFVLGASLIASSFFFTGGTATALLISGVSTLAGSLLAPKPPRQATLEQDVSDKKPEIKGSSNTFSKKIVPVFFGINVRFTHYYGQQPIIETQDGGSNNQFNQFFIAGYDNIIISNDKLGETDLSEYGGAVTIQKSYGGAVYIGYDNIDVNIKEQQLVIDKETSTDNIIRTDLTYQGSLTTSFELEYSALSDINEFSDKQVSLFTSEDSVLFDITKDDLVTSYLELDTMTSINTPAGNEAYGGANAWLMFDKSILTSYNPSGYALRNITGALSKVDLTMDAGTYDFDIVYTNDTLPSAGDDVSGLNYTNVLSITSETFTQDETKSYDVVIPETATGWGININGNVLRLDGFKTEKYTYIAPDTPLNIIIEQFISFQNQVNTRQTATEVLETLSCVFKSYTIDSTPTLVESGFNKFTGIASRVIDTTPDDTKEINFVYSFSQGLFRQNDNGTRSRRAVNVKTTFKAVGGLSELPLSDANAIFVIDNGKQYLTDNGQGIYSNPNTTTTYNSNTNQITLYSPEDTTVIDELFFRNIGIEVDEDKYVYFVSSLGAVGGKTNKDVGSITLREIQSLVSGDAMNTGLLPNLTQVRLEAKASTQRLDGTLKQSNGVISTRIPIWNGVDWNDEAFSNNPSAVIRYLLTDPRANVRYTENVLDDESFIEFYNFCETEGFKAQGVVNDFKKIRSIVDDILGNCQSKLKDVEGKIGIAIDKQKTPTQIITPHNSWDLNIKCSLGKKVNAIRYSFINDEYKEDRITAYWYNNQVNFTPEGGTSDTDYIMQTRDILYTYDLSHIQKIAIYQLKSAQTRLRDFSYRVNLESLDLSLYDNVLVSDVVSNIETSGFIKEVIIIGGLIYGFKLYSPVVFEEPQNEYKIYIRSMVENGAEGDFQMSSFTISNRNERTHIVKLLTPQADTGIIKGRTTQVYESQSGVYQGDLFDINDSSIHQVVITGAREEEELTATIEGTETTEGFWQ